MNLVQVIYMYDRWQKKFGSFSEQKCLLFSAIHIYKMSLYKHLARPRSTMNLVRINIYLTYLDIPCKMLARPRSA